MGQKSANRNGMMSHFHEDWQVIDSLWFANGSNRHKNACR